MSKSKSSVIVIDRSLINSPAFRSLKGTAVVVLLDFLGKRRLAKRKFKDKRQPIWKIENNGEITYTYTEAEKRGISRPSFRNAIDSLIDRGFIDIAESGAGLYKATTFYSISERWKAWGTDEFVIKNREKKKLWKKGIGFQKGHAYYPPKN